MQRRERLIHRRAGLVRQLIARAAHLSDQRVGSVESNLPVFSSRDTDITAKHQAKVGHAIAQVAGNLHLIDAALVQRAGNVVKGLLQQCFETSADLFGNSDERLHGLINLPIVIDQLAERLLQDTRLVADPSEHIGVDRNGQNLQAVLDGLAQVVQSRRVALRIARVRLGGVGLRSDPEAQRIGLHL